MASKRDSAVTEICFYFAVEANTARSLAAAFKPPATFTQPQDNHVNSAPTPMHPLSNVLAEPCPTKFLTTMVWLRSFRGSGEPLNVARTPKTTCEPRSAFPTDVTHQRNSETTGPLIAPFMNSGNGMDVEAQSRSKSTIKRDTGLHLEPKHHVNNTHPQTREDTKQTALISDCDSKHSHGRWSSRGVSATDRWSKSV